MKARIPKGMGQPNMQNLMKQAQKMQEDMELKKDELSAREYEIKAGGGAVTIVINGEKQIKTLNIDPEIVDPDDIETMTDILIAAFNEAVKRVETDAEDEMQKITGALGLPGMF